MLQTSSVSAKRRGIQKSQPNQRQKKKKAKARRGKSRRKRRHLCAAPALLPVLLLQLCVLHSQLEAGQLGHERLVTHMERIRDGELERERGRQEEGNDGGRRRAENKEKRARHG